MNTPYPSTTSSALDLLKEVQTLRREVTALKRIVGALNRRLLVLEKGKGDGE